MASVSHLPAGLTAWGYWPALRCEFVDLDDDVYVTANDQVQAGLSSDSIRWAFALEHYDWGFYWQPLTWLSLGADRPPGAAGSEPPRESP